MRIDPLGVVQGVKTMTRFSEVLRIETALAVAFLLMCMVWPKILVSVMIMVFIAINHLAALWQFVVDVPGLDFK